MKNLSLFYYKWNYIINIIRNVNCIQTNFTDLISSFNSKTTPHRVFVSYRNMELTYQSLNRRDSPIWFAFQICSGDEFREFEFSEGIPRETGMREGSNLTTSVA